MQKQGGFEREVMPFLDSAYNFACHLTGDAAAAESIVQAACLRAGRIPGAGAGRIWFLKLVRDGYRAWLISRWQLHRRNCKLTKASVSNARRSFVMRSEDGADAGDAPCACDSGQVRLALEALPRRLREILVLRELEGCSYREISDITSLPTGEVMLRLARARRRLAGSMRMREMAAPSVVRVGPAEIRTAAE